jgi:hypothetical protein
MEVSGHKDIAGLFLMFGHLMAWTSFFSVVVRTVWSTSTDMINEDLMFYSSIKPLEIVCGKLFSGVIITLILMSITAPFLTLVYSMGGVDLVILAIMLVEIFVIIQVFNALAILVASTAKIRFSPFIGLIIVSIAFVVLNVLTNMVVLNEWFGMDRSEMLLEFAGLLFAEVAAFVFIVSVAVAMLSPQNSNRLFPMRIIVTIIFIAAVVCTLFEIFLAPLSDVLPYVEITCLLALMLFLILSVCERDQWTPRIRVGLPKSLILRAILFPFCTGSPCGVVWIMLMMAVLVYVDLMILLPMNLSRGAFSLFYFNPYDDRCYNGPLLLFIFFFNFCVTAMLIRSWFWKKVDASRVWLIAICLMVFLSGGSMVVYIIGLEVGNLLYGEEQSFYWAVAGSNWYEQYNNSLVSSLDPMNIIWQLIFDMFWATQFLSQHYGMKFLLRHYAMFGWAVILLFLLFIWYRQRLKDFSPYNINETTSYDDAVKIIKQRDQKLTNAKNESNLKK